MSIVFRRMLLQHGVSPRKKNMIHVDALSHNLLPVCLMIDESGAGLMARLKKAQEEDDSVRRLRDLVFHRQAPDYILRGNLLFRVSNGDL